MIEGIDIFTPRDSGLPDFSKLSPAQIFNGSVAASMNAMKETDPLGLLKNRSAEGIEESPWKTTTIDERTGKRVEVRKASVVEDLLSGGSPARRGHRSVNGSGGYSRGPEPDLPENPQTPADASLLSTPPPEWHPPMLMPSTEDNGNILLFPDLSPAEKKDAALRKLPTLLLEELKTLHLV